MAQFPRDWKAFRKWRKAADLPPALAKQAELVENDLRMLPQLSPAMNQTTIAGIEKNIADFEAKLKAQG